MPENNNWADITYRIIHWLHRNDVDPDGARLVIELGSSQDVGLALAGLRSEFKPYELTIATMAGTEAPQVNGLYLEFRHVRKS